MLLRCARKVGGFVFGWWVAVGGCFAAEKAARKVLELLGWVETRRSLSIGYNLARGGRLKLMVGDIRKASFVRGDCFAAEKAARKVIDLFWVGVATLAKSWVCLKVVKELEEGIEEVFPIGVEGFD